MKRFLVAAGGSVFVWSTVAVGDPIPPIAPPAVPGKEYSNHMDEDSAGVLDPHQNIFWNGLGGAANTFDYTGAGVIIGGVSAGILDGAVNVDALANNGDSLYQEVTTDQVTMLASGTGDGRIHYTAAAHHFAAPPPPGIHGTPPKVGLWAAPAIINAGAPPDDVDGLEVWGPRGAGGDDANLFSLIGDPALAAGAARTSVWWFDPVAGTVEDYILASEIATAIGRPDLTDQIDVDAMMVLDILGLPPQHIAPGDSIMFSIAPIPMPADGLPPLDGGEIWVFTAGAGLAPFLGHGGELWDTAHSVADHFGVAWENINALEAVPEPGSLALVAFGGLLLARRRQRRW